MHVETADPLPAPVKFGQLKLSRKMTVEQAFRAIVTACLAQVRDNAGGVAGGDDPEHVHQMRVGLRHLKSALNLFRELIPLPAPLQVELDWLGTELGPARDWEVLAQSTLALVQPAEPKDISALGLVPAAAAMAQEWRAQAAAAIGSERYRTLLRDMEAWLAGAEWRADAAPGASRAPDARAPRSADKMLARSHRRLLRRGKKLRRGCDAGERHQVRIAAKKARYAMEFFAGLYPARQVRKYAAALADLQDELGRLNDAAVADALLPELEAARPDLAPAIGFARGYLAAMPEHDERQLGKLWKRFERLSLPRRK